MTPKCLTILDTTLRDGEQSPGCSMNLAEKVRLARKLEILGVDVIEAGFPAASEGDFDAVQAVAHECPNVKIAALSRALESEISLTVEALRNAAQPRLHIVIATSEIHLKHKLKKTRAEVLAMTKEAVELGCALIEEVEFSAEDATRTDVGYLCEVIATAIEAGARIINIPDTVGYALPGEFGNLIRTIRTDVVRDHDVTISVHCHNDLGLAVANTLSAIEAGARQVECTVNGIGERAGNAALEEIVMAIHVRAEHFRLPNNVKTEELFSTSQLLASIVGFSPQPNKAIVGRNAFAHEAGIHQHGVLSNPLCYEIMKPELVGVPSNRIVLGKHSGHHALSYYYTRLGYTLSSIELDLTYRKLIRLADRKKRIYDQDLISILPERLRLPVASEEEAEVRGQPAKQSQAL